MRRIASFLGMLMIVNGIFDFVFPRAMVSFFTEGPGSALGGPFSAMARDFSDLENNTLRYLGASTAIIGGLLLWLGSGGETETVEEAKTIRIRPGRMIVRR